MAMILKGLMKVKMEKYSVFKKKNEHANMSA
jgi:hypothetical protein